MREAGYLSDSLVVVMILVSVLVLTLVASCFSAAADPACPEVVTVCESLEAEGAGVVVWSCSDFPLQGEMAGLCQYGDDEP